MKKLMTLVAVLSMTSIAWAGSREATNDRLDHAGRVIQEIMSAPDRGIPEEVLEHARCIAVVPHMLKVRRKAPPPASDECLIFRRRTGLGPAQHGHPRPKPS